MNRNYSHQCPISSTRAWTATWSASRRASSGDTGQLLQKQKRKEKTSITRALLRQPRSLHPGYKFTAPKIAASAMESRIEKPPLRIRYSVASAIMQQKQYEKSAMSIGPLQTRRNSTNEFPAARLPIAGNKNPHAGVKGHQQKWRAFWPRRLLACHQK